MSCTLFFATFLHSWQSISVLAFLNGLSISGYLVSVGTLVMETLTDAKQRMFARSLMDMWGPARIMYALVAYATRNWRTTFQVCPCRVLFSQFSFLCSVARVSLVIFFSLL